MEAKITEDHFIEYMALDFPSFKVTKCNLTYPTSDFVASFYTLMMEAMTCINNTNQLWDLTEEQCALIKANQNEGYSFLNHIYSRNLHAAVKYIFSQVNPNVPEFSYSDILLPENTPRRTFVNMSFMLNCFYYFISFSEELHEEMVACEEKGKEILNKRELKSKLINELKEYEDRKKDRADLLKNIKASILKYFAKNNEKENIIKDISAKNNLIIADLKTADERENNYQDELQRLQNSINHFQSLIVQNPNEAAEIHARNEMQTAECKDKMKNLEEQVKISSNRLARFGKIIELLHVLNNVILKHEGYPGDATRDFRELQNHINNLSNKLSNLKNLESNYTMQFIQKELVIPKLKSECAQQESDQASIICKGEERCRICKEYIENQEKSYTKLSIKMRKDGDELGEINSHICEMSKKCAEIENHVKHIENDTKEMHSWCTSEIKSSFNFVHDILSQKLSGIES